MYARFIVENRITSEQKRNLLSLGLCVLKNIFNKVNGSIVQKPLAVGA